MSRNAHPQRPPAEGNSLFPCYQSEATTEPSRLVDKKRRISFENKLRPPTIYQLQQPPVEVSNNCEKSKDDDDVDGECYHNPAAVSKAIKGSSLKNEDRSIPVYSVAVSKPLSRDLKQSLMAVVRRNFNNTDPHQLQQLSFNELQLLNAVISLESTPEGKKSTPDLKLALKDYSRDHRRQFIDCLPLGTKPTPTDSDPKFDAHSTVKVVTVGDKLSDPLPWVDPEKCPVDQPGDVLPPAIAQESSVSCEEDTTKDSCEGRVPTGGEAEGVGTDAQKSSSHSQDLERSPSLDSSDTSSIESSLDYFDDDANSQGQSVLLTIFGSPSSRVQSLWSLLLSILRVVLLLVLVFLPTRNSNHSLAIYSRHDLVLSTVSADLACLPVCPNYQLKYSVSFLIQLHMKHIEKWPGSTETLPNSPSLTRSLKRFPSLDLPTCSLNSESTEIVMCLLAESPKVPLCLTPPSVTTKSEHADIQTDIQKEIKEFSWGIYSEAKAIVPNAQSVEHNKPYTHSDNETLIWHTQYEAYPEMEIQYANASHLLTVFLTVLCMSNLSKDRRIVATSTNKVRLISADLPPDKPLQSNRFSSAEAEIKPGSRSVVCSPHPMTEHQSHSSRLSCDFTPKEDTVYKSCDTQGDLDMDTAEQPNSVVCPSTDKNPMTERQGNRFPCGTCKDDFIPKVDAVCDTTPALQLLPFNPSGPSSPNAAHDDDIQEGFGYYRKYCGEDNELTEQSLRKQGNSESGFVSNGSTSSSLLDPSEERLPLTDPIPKTPDHTQEQTDGGGGGSGSGSGTSCGGGSRSEGGTGDGGVGGGSEGGGSGPGAGGSGGDDRDNQDRSRREGSLADCETKKPTTPDKDKKKQRPPEDSQTSDSGYKTKALSTSNSAPTADHIKQGLTPRTNVSLYTTGASILVYPHPHLQPRLELVEDTQQPQLQPVGEPPAVASGLESQPPNGASSVFEVPNKEHHYSPVSTESDEIQAQNSPPRQCHNPPPPFSNSYPSQEDVPVAPRAVSSEHSTREEPQIPIKESGKQSGASEMVCSLLQRPLDCAGNHPVSSGGCKLETPYWKLIDGTSLVLEIPGDDYFPPETPDNDDPSQGQDRPPRRHHNPPPPFPNSYPHDELPVALSPALDQVEAGAADEENSDPSDNGDWVEDWIENNDNLESNDHSEDSSSEAEELGEEDSGMGDSD